MGMPNIHDLRWRQFRSSILGAAAWSIAALLAHVADVIGARAQKQMLRVDTRRVVAFVKNALATLNVAMREFPRDAMDRLLAPLPPAVAVALARGSTRAGPYPAVIGPHDFRPELFGRFHGAIVSRSASDDLQVTMVIGMPGM